MLTVRPATTADAAELARLRYEFRAAERPAREARDAFITRCTAWMRERLARGSTWHCLIAEKDGTTVGHVWLEVVDKVPNPGAGEPERHVYLTNLYVRPDARGGPGSALVEAALAWCRERRADTVILWPSEKSRTLYARYGFAPSTDILALSLKTSGSAISPT
jgi:GNAT superfamily N-acetyltransferase